ncbi:MAG: uncharacterized protein QOE14_1161 [Humisphaera sp.]|nr:uncharacterized protein [Humisphaera sp.]
MSDAAPRVVYDCNIYVQALINSAGPAGRCVDEAIDGAVALFVSPFVLAEIRESHVKIPSKYGVTAGQTAALADGIAKIATLVAVVPAEFVYTRDPDDAHYVNVALAANARLVISRDRDLLDLMDPARQEGRDFQTRFPQLRILEPVQFLRELDAERQA